MFAFIVVDTDGSEGIPAAMLGDSWMPLMGADMERVESLRSLAMAVCTPGTKLSLVKFTTRTLIEEIEVPQ